MSSILEQVKNQSRIQHQNEQYQRDLEAAQLESVLSLSLESCKSSYPPGGLNFNNGPGDSKSSVAQREADERRAAEAKRLAEQRAAEQQRLNQRRLEDEKIKHQSQVSAQSVNRDPNRSATAGSSNAPVVEATILIFNTTLVNNDSESNHGSNCGRKKGHHKAKKEKHKNGRAHDENFWKNHPGCGRGRPW